jgi:cytochrome c5
MYMSTHDAHESPIKTPKQLITTIVLCFIIPITLLILLAGWVANGVKPQAGLDKAQIVQRTEGLIKPIASHVYKTVDEVRTGEQTYTEVCASCHAAGLMNAPKFGDIAGWATRLKMGLEGLVASAIKGKGAMPAKGGNADLSDTDIQNAVIYMTNASGASFKAPVIEAVATASVAISKEVPATPVITPMPVASTPVPAPVAAVVVADAGKKLYESVCMGCHAAGIAGAPKFGDKAAWAARSTVGVDALVASVIKGKGIMAARGGSQATDADLKQTVQYMLAAAK